jgi:hypothetical protein
MMLVRTPAAGGNWSRVRALGEGSVPATRFQIIGERYFFDTYAREGNERAVISASLASADPPLRILQRPRRFDEVDSLWIGTESAFFWSDGYAIYTRALDSR